MQHNCSNDLHPPSVGILLIRCLAAAHMHNAGIIIICHLSGAQACMLIMLMIEVININTRNKIKNGCRNSADVYTVTTLGWAADHL